MSFISETVVNKIVEEATASTAEQIETLGQEQAIVLAYLVSEQFDLLMLKEKDYFIYLAWVLYKSVLEVEGVIDFISEEQIGEAEEANWAMIEAGNKKDFRKQLDPFFESTDQEDLLAFVEDALVDDEEDFITFAGRELMFVGLKTLIDVLS